MGFFDFFRRKKLPALPEGTKEIAETSTPRASTFDEDIKVDISSLQAPITANNLFLDPNSQTQLFPSTKNGVITYTFCRNNMSGARIELAEFSSEDVKQKGMEYFKNLIQVIDAAINMPFGVEPDALNRSKRSAKARLESLSKNHPRFKIKP